MKKVLNVGIGGRSFVIDEDAYYKLSDYLDEFRKMAAVGLYAKEMMEDLELRIAEIFAESLHPGQEVVDLAMVNAVIARLGMPDGSDGFAGEDTKTGKNCEAFENEPKKLFRDMENKAIGGVCSGLACYCNIDVLVIRILFICLLLLGSTGFWLYVILWAVVPVARTGADKCRMHGVPVTAENIRKFYNQSHNK